MRPEQVKRELDDCLGFLQRVGFSAQEMWCHFDGDSLVSSRDRLGMLKFDNIREYMFLHKRICERKQFTMLAFDNTIICIEFRFYNMEIAESRYLVLPDLTIYSGESMPDAFANEETSRYLEMTNDYQLNFPIRIDFINSRFKNERQNPVVPGSHSPSHMHLGFIEGCRIPISRPISPKVFFKFVIENFYSRFYEKNEKNLKGFLKIDRENLFDEEISVLDKAKLYFDISV